MSNSLSNLQAALINLKNKISILFRLVFYVLSNQVLERAHLEKINLGVVRFSFLLLEVLFSLKSNSDSSRNSVHSLGPDELVEDHADSVVLCQHVFLGKSLDLPDSFGGHEFELSLVASLVQINRVVSFNSGEVLFNLLCHRL